MEVKNTKQIKKIATILLILTLLLSSMIVSFADDTPIYVSGFEIIPSRIGLVIDGKIQTWDKDYGKILLTNKSRTVIPIAIVSQRLGYQVGWEGETQIVSIFKYKKDNEGNILKDKDEKPIKETDVSFQLGDTEIKWDGGIVKMDIPAFAKDGRTYLPFQFLADVLGHKVEWKSHSHIEGSKDYPYDFYVVVSSDENSSDKNYNTNPATKGMTQEQINTFYSTKNPNIAKIVEDAGKMSVYGEGKYPIYTYDTDTKILLGQSPMPANERYAWLKVLTFGQEEVEIIIHGWNREATKVTMKKLLKIWYPQDAEYIYKQIDEDFTHEWDEWWSCPNGTVVKAEHNGTMHFKK